MSGVRDEVDLRLVIGEPQPHAGQTAVGVDLLDYVRNYAMHLGGHRSSLTLDPLCRSAGNYAARSRIGDVAGQGVS
jgi:hypothetical protein